MTTAPQPTFLSLPLEVRQIIYDFCYSDPLSDSTHEWVPISEPEPTSKQKNKKRRLCKRDNGTVKQLRTIATKCHFPTCHLSLLSVSQQIRNEFFPIFAAHHTFSFHDPLVFANEYLSLTPPHRYSCIRHLALYWKTPAVTCGCEVDGQCRTHPSKAPDISRDMRNFLALVNIYPELFSNMESIRFNLQLLGSESTWGQRVDLFKNIVFLLEKLDDLNSTAGVEKPRYLVVPHSLGGSYTSPTQVDIFVVPNDTWTLAVDGSTLEPKICEQCELVQHSWVLLYRYCKEHDIDWTDTNQFISALQDGKFSQRTTTPLGEIPIEDICTGGEKDWKVLFDTTQALRNAWEHAMRDYNVWKGTDRQPKQRGTRKRKTVDREIYGSVLE